MKTKKYPRWVCRDCALKAKGKILDRIATWHDAKCDVCGKVKAVTEPRDFGHPKFNDYDGS